MLVPVLRFHHRSARQRVSVHRLLSHLHSAPARQFPQAAANLLHFHPAPVKVPVVHLRRRFPPVPASHPVVLNLHHSPRRVRCLPVPASPPHPAQAPQYHRPSPQVPARVHRHHSRQLPAPAPASHLRPVNHRVLVHLRQPAHPQVSRRLRVRASVPALAPVSRSVSVPVSHRVRQPRSQYQSAPHSRPVAALHPVVAQRRVR